MAGITKCKVMIVQTIVPRYRVGFFEALANSEICDLVIAFGKEPIHSELKSCLHEGGYEKLFLQNHFFSFANLFWQHGLIRSKHLFQSDILILEQNPRCLSSITAALLAKALRKRVIWWGHGLSNIPNPLNTMIRVLMSRFAEGNIIYSQSRAQKLIEAGVIKSKIFVALNSIDSAKIKSLRLKMDADCRTRILCVGRLIPQKKCDILMKAFSFAIEALPKEDILTFIGDGPMYESLNKLAYELKIDHRVEFTGPIWNEERLAGFFNDSWISVSSGYIGLAAIHSLAYGIPMIVADSEPHSPEIEAIRFGENSFKFSKDNSRDLADTLLCLRRNPVRLNKMSVNAMEMIDSSYGYDIMVNAFKEAIKGRKE